MVITGNGRGCSRSAIVSPIMICSMPATATTSPADTASVETRSSPSATCSSAIFARSTEPSARHQATVSPRWIVPS